MAKPVLFHNANVYTVDDVRPRAGWFTVLGDRFQRVGEGPPPESGRSVDLRGRTVVPGFVDAHAHFFQTGLDILFVDLTQCRTFEEVIAALKGGARGRRSWIFAHGFEEDLMDDIDRLTRWELDDAFPKRPVWVNRIDYHSAIVNSAALRRLEIPQGTPGLLKDGNSKSGGKPNGILRERAYFHAKARIARLYPVETKEKAVKAAADRCSRAGITAVHALEGGKIFGDEGVPTVLKKIGSIPLDVTLFLQEKNVFLTTRLGFEHLGGCILVDGSIGSYTAALEEDYEGMKGHCGVLYEKPRELQSFVEEAHSAGVQLAFHAIGPRAIDMVLDAYERAIRRSPRYDHRHRIEHFELATDAQIARARDLGVIVSMQPAFEHFWGGPDGMYATRLGSGWSRTNRLRSIMDRGVTIAGGSDTNVTPPDPILGIHSAVNHPNEEQRISVEAALRMMTLSAAYAGFNERWHGTISPGKEADFVVLDQDPLQVPSERIGDTRVLETWYRGRCAHRALRDRETMRP